MNSGLNGNIVRLVRPGGSGARRLAGGARQPQRTHPRCRNFQDRPGANGAQLPSGSRTFFQTVARDQGFSTAGNRSGLNAPLPVSPQASKGRGRHRHHSRAQFLPPPHLSPASRHIAKRREAGRVRHSCLLPLRNLPQDIGCASHSRCASESGH